MAVDAVMSCDHILGGAHFEMMFCTVRVKSLLGSMIAALIALSDN